MIRRFPSRFRAIAIWMILLAGRSVQTGGQQPLINALPRATATIRGKIILEGPALSNTPVQMSTDP